MSEIKDRACAIAQDLMPLQLDGLCSEESRSFISEHIRGCEKCRLLYEEMQTSVTAPVSSSEKPLLGFRRFMHTRTRKTVLLTALIIITAIATLTGLYVGLWADKSHPLPLKLYDVSLWQTTDGYVFLDYDFDGTDFGYNGGISSSYGPDENGRMIVYTYASSSLIPERMKTDLRHVITGYYLYEGQLYEARGYSDGSFYSLVLDGPIDEVRQGTNEEYRVIYRAGGSIPVCSEEMQQYISEYLTDDIYYRRSWKDPASISLQPDEILVNTELSE